MTHHDALSISGSPQGNQRMTHREVVGHQYECTESTKEWRTVKLLVSVVLHESNQRMTHHEALGVSGSARRKWSKNDESWSCWQAPKSRKKDTVSNCPQSWRTVKLLIHIILSQSQTRGRVDLTRTDDEASRCWCQRPTRNKINDYAITITSRRPRRRVSRPALRVVWSQGGIHGLCVSRTPSRGNDSDPAPRCRHR